MSHLLLSLPLDTPPPTPPLQDQINTLTTQVGAASGEGDTAWVLASAALVLLMTVALAFFYAGMVRAKNALGMLMQNFYCIAAVSIVWVLCGYSLAFGPGQGFM